MRTTIYKVKIVLMIIAISASGCQSLLTPKSPVDTSWQEEFGLDKRTLVSTGRNTYFILEPGFQLILEGGREKLAVTVLDETREVDGVETRVVEEREWRDDKLIEVSRNFFAICEEAKDVFYFGEEVDMMQDGKVISHSGAWLAGEQGAHAGLIMPGDPEVGARYYQEIAPGVAMDRAEVISVNVTFETLSGTFTKCLKTKEGTALNLVEQEFKTYAPEIGLIQDQNLRLTSYGMVTLP